ncbi:MAG: class II aldolase/adducin family protein, partial [Verrucomicrobiae bacterium]|nr:class II aldolase/adducin family protein [Verrucomicrobiae bacterium]
HATAFAQAGREIPPLGTTHADHFRGAVPVARPLTEAEVSGEYELNTGRVIAECFRHRHIDPMSVPAVLVHGHGPFAWGNSVEHALENAIALEFCAQIAALTWQLDPPASTIPQFLLDRHFLRKHGPGASYGQP